ncbi:MAG: hypothetical protein HY748_14495 [Elusimicrobia bacterium]|nr:hypothetical protein [Elusimicrobiota bacterium]
MSLSTSAAVLASCRVTLLAPLGSLSSGPEGAGVWLPRAGSRVPTTATGCSAAGTRSRAEPERPGCP